MCRPGRLAFTRAGQNGFTGQRRRARQLTPLPREVDGDQKGAFGGLIDSIQYDDKSLSHCARLRHPWAHSGGRVSLRANEPALT